MVEKFKEMFEILAWPFPRGGNEGDRKISLYKPLYQVAIVCKCHILDDLFHLLQGVMSKQLLTYI